MVTKKMCNTNKNVTKMGVIIKGIYFITHNLKFFGFFDKYQCEYIWGLFDWTLVFWDFFNRIFEVSHHNFPTGRLTKCCHKNNNVAQILTVIKLVVSEKYRPYMLSGVGYDYKSDPIAAQIFVYEVFFGLITIIIMWNKYVSSAKARPGLWILKYPNMIWVLGLYQVHLWLIYIYIYIYPFKYPMDFNLQTSYTPQTGHNH